MKTLGPTAKASRRLLQLGLLMAPVVIFLILGGFRWIMAVMGFSLGLILLALAYLKEEGFGEED